MPRSAEIQQMQPQTRHPPFLTLWPSNRRSRLLVRFSAILEDLRAITLGDFRLERLQVRGNRYWLHVLQSSEDNQEYPQERPTNVNHRFHLISANVQRHRHLTDG